ncbi:Coiled-coil domain-containing protein 96 [Phlyctochytrium planicorne]|nr:Coiled-coil domain-containing protein 96 [Phlyctochytrium planicorne]
MEETAKSNGPSRAVSTKPLSGSRSGSRASLGGSQVLKKSALTSSKASLRGTSAPGNDEDEKTAPGTASEETTAPGSAGQEEPAASFESGTEQAAANSAEGSPSSDQIEAKPEEAEAGVEVDSPEAVPPENIELEASPVDGTVAGENGEDVELTRLEAMEHSIEQMITDAKEEEQEIQEIGEEIEITPAIERTMTSPPPNDIQGFTFMNVNYEEDPDIPMMILTTRLSRSESVMSGEAPTTHPASRVRTPMLRASTPTLVEPKEEVSLVDGKKDGKDADEAGEDADTAGAATASMLEEGVDREALILGIRLALDLREKYRTKNTFLQNKLGEYFRRKRADENHDGEKSVTDQEQRYANCMSALQDLRNEFEMLNSTNQKVVNEYKLRLEERILEAESKATEFVKYKRTVALGAENSRTGKPLPTKVVDQLEATELRKEADVVAVRLENIKLRNKLRRHEQLLRQKEELADGLHLIDFEQLKIENQTYNEKIEERNEELLKLRKKITNIVQVLTHVKEKLQFVQVRKAKSDSESYGIRGQGENVDLKRKLRQLDDEVSAKRDSLPLAKQARDALRANSHSLRQKNGLLGNISLLRDFEEKVPDAHAFVQDESMALKNRIDDLRACHADLCAETLAIKRRIHRKMV